MELAEDIDYINKSLRDFFGNDIVTGLSMFRVVWSEEQFEKRRGTYDDYTPAGLYICTVTEVREVPKYNQWIKERYVLERLVAIPEISQDDLPVSRISYEPLWVFEDVKGTYLPPKLTACKLVIDTVYASMGRGLLAKYKDPDNSTEAERENTRSRVAKIQDELFGDETIISDALARKEGIVVPHTYKGDS